MVEMYKRKKEKLVPRHMDPLGSADNRFCSTQPDTSLHSESADREIVAVVHQRPCLQHLAYCSVNSRHISSQSRFLPTPLVFDAPVRGFPSEHRHPVWYGKTRMVWLLNGEKISKISLFVLTQSTNVTDTQTDRERDTHRHRMTT